MLLLPVLEKEENENGGADELLPLWRKREKHQWRGRSVVERMVVQPAVTDKPRRSNRVPIKNPRYEG